MEIKRIKETEEMTVDYAFHLLLLVLVDHDGFRRADVMYGLPLDAFNSLDHSSDFATTNLKRCGEYWTRALCRASGFGLVVHLHDGYWKTTAKGREFSAIFKDANLIEYVD